MNLSEVLSKGLRRKDVRFLKQLLLDLPVNAYQYFCLISLNALEMLSRVIEVTQPVEIQIHLLNLASKDLGTVVATLKNKKYQDVCVSLWKKVV